MGGRDASDQICDSSRCIPARDPRTLAAWARAAICTRMSKVAVRNCALSSPARSSAIRPMYCASTSGARVGDQHRQHVVRVAERAPARVAVEDWRRRVPAIGRAVRGRGLRALPPGQRVPEAALQRRRPRRQRHRRQRELQPTGGLLAVDEADHPVGRDGGHEARALVAVAPADHRLEGELRPRRRRGHAPVATGASGKTAPGCVHRESAPAPASTAAARASAASPRMSALASIITSFRERVVARQGQRRSQPTPRMAMGRARLWLAAGRKRAVSDGGKTSVARPP